MVLVTEDTSGLDIRQPVKRRLLTLPRFTLFCTFMKICVGVLGNAVLCGQLGQGGQGGRGGGGGAGIGGQVAAPVHLSWRRARPRIHQLPCCPQTTLPRPPASKPTGLVTPQSRQGSPPDAQTKASDPLSASKLIPASYFLQFFVID